VGGARSAPPAERRSYQGPTSQGHAHGAPAPFPQTRLFSGPLDFITRARASGAPIASVRPWRRPPGSAPCAATRPCRCPVGGRTRPPEPRTAARSGRGPPHGPSPQGPLFALPKKHPLLCGGWRGCRHPLCFCRNLGDNTVCYYQARSRGACTPTACARRAAAGCTAGPGGAPAATGGRRGHPVPPIPDCHIPRQSL
jgi:hypothetical protein